MPRTDHEMIVDLLYRYCRAVDRMDAKIGYSIWHDDGTADYGDGVYRGDGRGFIDFVNAQHANTLGHSHQVTNIILDIDGDRAASEAYHIAAIRIARGQDLQQITVHGRYIDRWSKRDGRWGIDHRIVVRDLDDIRAITPMSITIGTRDRNDPSYEVIR